MLAALGSAGKCTKNASVITQGYRLQFFRKIRDLGAERSHRCLILFAFHKGLSLRMIQRDEGIKVAVFVVRERNAGEKDCAENTEHQKNQSLFGTHHRSQLMPWP